MTAAEWKVGDRGRVGDAEFEVIYDRKSETVDVKWPNLLAYTNTISLNVLAAMGAVRIPPLVPPTIGHPQCVKDNPPPANEWILVGDEVGWFRAWNSFKSTLTYEWWMPMPSPPPPRVTP